jgi:hypothetical protein
LLDRDFLCRRSSKKSPGSLRGYYSTSRPE